MTLESLDESGRKGPSSDVHPELIDLLRRREAVIADHAWRDRDGQGHLDALREVSESIGTWTEANRAAIDPRLAHYLANASFSKALAHLTSSGTMPHRP